MSNVVLINDKELPIVEFKGQRVVTLAMMDEVHVRPAGTAKRNFNTHHLRLIEGEDFFKVGADEFRTRLNPSHSKYASEDVVLLAESGYLMLVKSFTDDLAWQVQRQLVNGYFKAKAQVPHTKQSHTGLPEFRRARAIDMATKAAERISAQFPSLSEDSRRVIFAKVINPVVGDDVIALPRIEQKHYSAGEVGEKLGISANMVGRIANQYDLKTVKHGQYRLDKSRHSSKQVESFAYNDAGVAAIAAFLTNPEPEPAAQAAQGSAQ